MAKQGVQMRLWQPIPRTEQPLAVLIVDDDELIRMHLQLALSNEGLQISEAANASQALELAGGRHFDIVLMDVRMPGLDGFAACEQLKLLPGHSTTPVVMLTGMDDQESIRRASEVGAIDYVTKPLSASVLAKRVRHIVQAQRNCIELDQQRASQSALLQAIPDSVLRFDNEGILLASNFTQGWSDLLPMRCAVGSSIQQIFAGVSPFDPVQALRRALHGDSTATQISWPALEDKRYEARFVASGPNDVMCILRDITEQVRQQRHIDQLSLSDSLTGLPNRACLLQLIQRQLDAQPDQPLCLLQLSFSQFASIQKHVGNQTADRLIALVADTLLSTSGAERQEQLSATARLPLLARSGDAEFHLLLAGDADEPALRSLLQRLGERFEEPLQVEPYEFRLPLRTGVATTQTSKDVDELFKMSGLAVQQACQQGLIEPVFYTPELHRQSQRQLTLESCLRKAIAQGELELAYQPKVCAHSGRLKSLEALCRWTHPQLGSIAPGEFIALAEDTGLILPLGEFVLERACQQSRDWQRAGLPIIPIAVNVSGHQFNQRQVDKQLFTLLERMDVPPQAIELEITESVLVEQRHVLRVLERIRERGIRIAIDDFGTGHSSLSMLKAFPVDILKIDRAFVSEIVEPGQAYALVDAIIALGHSLNLSLVAEGVETDAQLHYLRDRQCHLIQGYLTGRPMTADSIQTQFLQRLTA